MNKTRLKLIAAATIAAGVLTAGLGIVHAASTTNGHPSFMSGIVAAIAQKFNVNPSDVQQVVDQQLARQKTQAMTARPQSIADRLAQAVTDGKLTQAQATLIQNEEASVKTQMAALQGKTGTDLRTAMGQIMTSLKQWAADNNIPQQYLMFGSGRPQMGRGHGMGKGHAPSAPTSSSTSQ
ncbi:hypothetical protein KGO95_01240 [Patescibacteria group bacterium]|nr:hypothetical protein [Patescibacteria group bacterium]